jgi:hypothetical protein
MVACVVCPSIYPSFWWLVLSVLPFTLLSDGLCCLSFDLPFFLMVIVLFVLLRFTASYYPFDILDLRLLITPLVSDLP